MMLITGIYKEALNSAVPGGAVGSYRNTTNNAPNNMEHKPTSGVRRLNDATKNWRAIKALGGQDSAGLRQAVTAWLCSLPTRTLPAPCHRAPCHSTTC